MRPKLAFGLFVAIGIVVAASLAFFVSPEASSKPDGLNKVAIDHGFDHTERDHALADLPTAHYSIRGVGNSRLATGLAGLLGVAVTFGLGAGAVFVLRRTGPSPRRPS